VLLQKSLFLSAVWVTVHFYTQRGINGSKVSLRETTPKSKYCETLVENHALISHPKKILILDLSYVFKFMETSASRSGICWLKEQTLIPKMTGQTSSSGIFVG